MTARRIALALLVAGCSRLDVARAPSVQSVVPAGAYRGQTVRVRVTGTDFQARGVQHLAGGGDVSTRFVVRIGGVALDSVDYVGEVNGECIVEGNVPADLPVGTHDVELVDPYGLSAVLHGAFTETDRAPPQLSALVQAPAAMEIGVPFTARVQFANAGGTAARITSTVFAGSTSNPDLVLAPGANGSVDLPAVLTTRGAVTLAVQATATDEVTGLALAPTQAAAAVVGLLPPALSVTFHGVPQAVDVGQTFAVTVTVANAGEVDALAATPRIAPDPALSAALLAPQDVPAGSARDFIVTLQGGIASTIAAQVSASAIDPLSGATVAAPAVFSAPIAVQAAANLRVVSVSAPAAVSVGQQFTLDLFVENSGDAVAIAVSDASPASLSSSIVAAPAPQDVPGHAQTLFRWTMRAGAAGMAQVNAAVAGLDGNTLAATGASSSALVQMQTPAALSVQLAAPARLSTGQSFAVTEQIANAGDAPATALSVTPPDCGALAALQTTPVLPTSIAGHGSVSLSWGFTATAAGALSCTASVQGSDANSGAAVQASATASSTVVAAAALTITSVSLPSVLSRGQTIAAQVTVRNTGAATALGVVAALTMASGSAAVAAAPPAQDVAGGASATFTVSLTENGSAPGTLAVRASAAGQDQNSGSTVTATPVTSAAATVQAPAALRIDNVSAPAQVSRGQSFTVSVTITNTGQASATGVTASFATLASGSAALTVTASPNAQTLAGGASKTFSWSCAESGTGPGALTLTASASGNDANSGAALSTAAQPVTITVQNPSSLSVSVQAPSALSRGQSFSITARVTNTGGATARNVQPAVTQLLTTGSASASLGALPAASDIASGATVAFTFSASENGTGTGTIAFTVAASGTDANSGAAVTASGTSASVPVLTPAALAITAFSATPSTIDRGQAFTVKATVSNTGQAGAAAVTVAVSQSGTAHASTSDAPGTVGLAGGGSATFTWNFVEDGTAPGSITFSAVASGVDANSGATLSTPPSSCAVTVQAPAALTAALSLPPTLSISDRFTVTMTVTNTGGATANNVQPGTLVASGTAGVSILSTPSPSTATLAGGAGTTFSWTLSATGAGTLQLDATVSGVDANDGAGRTASATVTQAVQAQPEATSLSSDPFASDGTTFAYLFAYQGMVYLGPNKSGTGAVRMAPDGSGATAINWTVEVDGNPSNPARNLAYQPPSPSRPCHTIGVLNCSQNTTACGQDDESGRAMFASGTVAGTEWYLVSGSSSIGGSRYVYMTNGGFPLASGGSDDLAFVQVQAGQAGSTRMMTAASFFQNQLFIGFADSSGTSPSNQQMAPVLNVLVNMPSLPGLVATLNSDLIDLGGANLPAIGSKGGNSGHSWLMIDSIRDLNGSLYVANNGGVIHSAGAPSPCASVGCSNWINATPSAAAWGAETSVTIDSTAIGNLEPSGRAVPGIVPFGGRLFMARNTTNGPQLWSCNPALGSDPQQCEPGDWSLVAANTSGDSRLTQLNDANNRAIAVLVATSRHLYVGFNNTGGAQLWRTANAAASTMTDFTGQQGCAAGSTGCAGVGGNGLGASLTRLFDARAFTDPAAFEWVYVSAGTGTGGPAVYRLAP